MSTVFKKILKNNFVIMVGILLTYIVLILYADIEKFSNIASNIDVSKIILAASLIIISIMLFAVRFHRLVSALGIKVNIRKSAMIYLFGLAFSVTPFSSGTIIKSHILKKEFQAPISKTFPIVLVEKWNELAAAILLLVFFLFISYNHEVLMITIAGIVLSSIFFAIIRYEKVFHMFEKIASRIPFLRKMRDNMNDSKQSMLILTNKRNTIESLGLTVISKILEAFAVIMIFQSLGFDGNFVPHIQAYYSGVFLGFISFIPGGLGLTEGSMLGLLVKFGNSFVLASTAVIIIRLITFWLPTVIGLTTTKYFMKEKFSF